jgi:hypothetical protein
MSVNGKPNEGDVYLDEDGYLVGVLKNSNGCWHRFYIGTDKKGATMWIGEAAPDAFIAKPLKYVLNIRELLISVRKELQDEPSS